MDAGIASTGDLTLRVPRAVPEAPLQAALKLFSSTALTTSCFYWRRQSQWDTHLSSGAASPAQCVATGGDSRGCMSQRRKTKETKSCSNTRHPQFKPHESNFNRHLLEAQLTFLPWCESGCTQKTRGGTRTFLQS